MTNLVASYDKIDQWLDWGDHTVTVDPIRTHPWIHEGQDSKHQDGVNAGRSYDRRDTKHMLALLQTTEPDALVKTYLPSASDIPQVFERKTGDTAVNDHGVSAPFDQVYSYRAGKIPHQRGTELPIVQHLNNRGTFAEANCSLCKGDIEREMYNEREQTRVFARGDHGLPL